MVVSREWLLFTTKAGNYYDSMSSRTLGAKVQRTRHAMDQLSRRSLKRHFAFLGTPLLVLGIMPGTVPASSAAPASLQAAIGRSLGSPGYSQQAELTGSSVGYGKSVALSAQGATALVGAPDETPPGQPLGAGGAHVFTLRHGTWTQTAELTASHGKEYDNFGSSVALSASGSTALIGTAGSGDAFVFALRHGTWSQTAELTAGGHLGVPVALSATGSTALIAGALGNSDTPAIYVFTLSHGRWSQTAELTAASAGSDSDFGYSLAVSANGSTVLVGAPWAQSQTGAAYVFTLRHGSWSQTAELHALHAEQYESFGQSVALSGPGSMALVAAPTYVLGTGAAFVFTLRGSSWSRATELTASDAAPRDELGSAVALSANGSTALAGAIFHDTDTGSAYVFTEDRGTWSQTAELAAAHGAHGIEFGTSLALSATGGTALIAAPVQNAGVVYVFTRH